MYLTQFDGTEGWSDSDPPLQFLSYSEAKSVTLKLWDSLFANLTGQSNVEVVMAPPETSDHKPMLGAKDAT
jgi:hypothetical protein